MSTHHPTEIPLETRRSRSRAASPPPGYHRTAAGRLHVNPPPGLSVPAPAASSSSITLEDLLRAQQQQNLLLQQQLTLLQEQRVSSQQYTDPLDVLSLVDPDLKPVLGDWMKEYKSTLQHHVNQADLQQKYLDIENAGELQRSFEDEASKEWQWPQAFKANAKKLMECVPVLGEGQEDRLAMQDDNTLPFDISEAYKAMRRRHARECQNFIVAYQRQCSKFFKDEARQDVQLQKLSDKIKTWFERYDGIFSASAQASMEAHAHTFAQLTFRKELPKARAKQEHDREQKAKQKDALTKAEAEFRLMGVNKLLAMAVLEFASLPSKGTAAKHQRVPSTSALAFLVKQHPDVAEKHNLIVQNNPKQPSAKPKPKPKPTRTSTRSASSQASHGSRASRNKSSSTRGSSSRSRASSKASSRTSSKSSRPSHRQGAGRHGSKGHGKGRGNKKAHQASQRSSGKQVRFRNKTPGPTRS